MKRRQKIDEQLVIHIIGVALIESKPEV